MLRALHVIEVADEHLRHVILRAANGSLGELAAKTHAARRRNSNRRGSPPRAAARTSNCQAGNSASTRRWAKVLYGPSSLLPASR
jgi:hypothetical protein